MKRLLALSLAATVMACGGGKVPREKHRTVGATEWREVLSPHFTLRTDMPLGEAEAASQTLEQMRLALVGGAFHLEVDPPGRLEAVLFRDQEELAEFIDSRVEGYVTSSGAGPLLVSAGVNLRNGEGRGKLLHELGHYLSAFIYLRQPTWFAEGLAEYVETAETSGGNVKLGFRHADNLRSLRRNGVLPLNVLWAAEDPDNRELAVSFHFYASAWLWYHFFEDKYPRQLSEYKDMLKRADDPLDAWATAFVNLKAQNMDDEIQKYLTQEKFAIQTARVPNPRVAIQARPMSAADVHALRAKLFLDSPARRTDAEKQSQADWEIARALELNPAQVEAVILRADSQKPAQRRTVARELVKAHPEDGRAWTFLAAELESVPQAKAERVQALETAARLNPDDAVALNNLAWERVEHGSAALGLKLSARAVQIAPWSPAMLDTYAAALFKVGRCPEARDAEERAVSLLHDDAANETRTELLASLVLYRRKCPTDSIPVERE